MKTKLKKIFKSTWAAATIIALSAAPVFAQDRINVQKGADDLGIIGNLTIPGLISGMIRLLVIAAAVIFFFMLVIGGIKWIMSGGDKAKTEEARSQITAALVGLVIVFAAWAIAQLVKALFGVDLFKLEIKQIPLV